MISANEDNKTRQQIRIPSYGTDADSFLKPSSFMDLAQEMANASATHLGFGFDDLQRSSLAWVLSRMHIEFPAMPRWRDEVELQTWHKGFEGPFYVRDFRMLDAQGHPAVLATSSWLVINTDTRRLVRREHLPSELPVDTEYPDSAIDTPCPKVALPSEGVEPAGSRIAAYSDVDMLGHANNARYVAWAMDCLDFDLVAHNRVRSLTINFNKEVRPGSNVEFFRAEIPGGWAVEGRVEGVSAFCVEIVLVRN